MQPLCWRRGPNFLDHIDRLSDTAWARLPAPTRACWAGVVAGDAVKRRVEEQMELWDVAPQWVVSSAWEAGLTDGGDHPTRLGCDCWVAMIGARHHMPAQARGRWSW
ncbi:MAG: type III pantothenate kinase [Burkholderiaceae bacterium]